MKKYLKKDFCGIALSTQKDNILKFNQYMKSDKTSCIIYADLESLIKKIDICENNPGKSSKSLNRLTYSLRIFNVNYMGISSYRK